MQTCVFACACICTCCSGKYAYLCICWQVVVHCMLQLTCHCAMWLQHLLSADWVSLPLSQRPCILNYQHSHRARSRHCLMLHLMSNKALAYHPMAHSSHMCQGEYWSWVVTSPVNKFGRINIVHMLHSQCIQNALHTNENYQTLWMAYCEPVNGNCYCMKLTGTVSVRMARWVKKTKRLCTK